VPPDLPNRRARPIVRYEMVDIDLTASAAMPSRNGYSGLGVVVRHRGVIQAFIMAPFRPGESRTDLVDRFLVASAEILLAASVRRELEPASQVPPERRLTLAICTKDRPDVLERCLDAVAVIRPPWVEIVVVDNASRTTETREIVAAHGEVGYVFENRPGLDFARNRALNEATSEWIAYIDDDVVVDRGYFDGLAAAWAEHPDAGAVTGLVLPLEFETEAQIIFERNGGFGRGFTPRRYASALSENSLYPCGSGIFGAGCNMAFDRRALLALGGFDEALDTGAPLPGGGDLDIFYRMIRASRILVYEPRMAVFHQHRRELDALQRQYWSWGLGFMAFVVKSYRADKDMQPQFRRLVRWWFRYQLRRFAKAAVGRGALPLRFVAAEIVGGIQGLFGAYDRSRHRLASHVDRDP
jgi:glycosyltransferase involved in cell wall biosynthesis